MLGLQSQQHINPHLNTGLKTTTDNEFDRAERAFYFQDSHFGDAELARYFTAAKVLIDHKEFRPAQKLLRHILSVNSNAAPAVKSLAVCARELGAPNEALALLKHLIKIENTPESLYLLGNELYQQGVEQSALKYFLQALSLNPTTDKLLFDLYKAIGNIFVRCHDFESAEEYYNKAFSLDSKSPALLVNLGTLEIQRENWNSALNRFRTAVTVDDTFDRAWVGLAMVHRQFADFELSWANLEKAIDMNPYNATALQLALSWVVKDQRWLQVADWLTNYLARHDDDAVMSLGLAQLWFVCGRYELSTIELTRALSIDPSVQGGTELHKMIVQQLEQESHGRDSDRDSAS